MEKVENTRIADHDQITKNLRLFLQKEVKEKSISKELKAKIIEIVSGLKPILLDTINSNHDEMVRREQAEKDLIEVTSNIRVNTQAVTNEAYNVDFPQLSYATTAREQHQKTPQVEKTLLVYPKKEGWDFQKTKKLLRDSAGPLANTVKDVINTRGNGIILKCNTSEDRERLRIALDSEQNKENITIKVPRNKKKVIIYSVPCEITEEDLKLSIVQLFPALEEEIFEVKAFPSEGETKNWLVTSTIRLQKLLIRSKRLCLKFNSCSIKEFFEVLRCFRCQGYGHTSYQCERPVVCNNCAGAHDTRDCKVEARRCINCLQRKSTRNAIVTGANATACDAVQKDSDQATDQTFANHRANSNQCPHYKYHLQRLKENSKRQWGNQN